LIPTKNKVYEARALSIRQKDPRTKYVWLVVERNEGSRFEKQLERMSEYSSEIDIIIIDGDSTDGTCESILKGNYAVSELIISKAKHGFSTDLQIGMLYAMKKGYSGVITSDGNGKDSVEDIKKFIELLDSGIDFIQGSRFLKAGNHANTPLLRYLGIRFVSSPFTSIVAKVKITDSTNGFRGYSMRLLKDPKLQLAQRMFAGYSLVSYVPFFVGKNKLKFAEIAVRRDYPKTGLTPTKIVSPSQWLQIFLDLFRAAFENYAYYDRHDWLNIIDGK